MNYLAAHIDLQTISWVIADMESAMVIEHGSFSMEGDEENTEELSDGQSRSHTHSLYPQQPYSNAIAFISQSICTNLEIDLPFSDIKKVEKVIPLQLQDKLPYDLENIHFVIKPEPTKIGELYRFFVSYIDKSLFETILSRLRALLIDFEIMTSEAFFLESLNRAMLQNFQSEVERYSDDIILVSVGYLTEDVPFSLDNINHQREAILSITQNEMTFHVRKLHLPAQDNFLFPYLESHVRMSLTSAGFEPKSIAEYIRTVIFCSDAIQEKTVEMFKLLPHSKIETLDPDYSPNITKIANPKLLFSLYSAQSLLYLKQQELPSNKLILNLRHGQYKFSAPLTEIKEAFNDHFIPYALSAFFGVLALCFSFLIPLKESSLITNQAYEMTSQELGTTFKKGNELLELDKANSDMEYRLGTLSTISSFSPIDWLYTLSAELPRDLSLDIETISVSTEGISFRGTVKDIPTTGTLRTILEKLQSESKGRFCDVTLDTDESVQGKRAVVGEIRICK